MIKPPYGEGQGERLNYSVTIQEAIEFMEAHIKEELTIEQIAKRVGYSVFHFSRVFTGQKGLSPMDYICKRRLSVARMELLQDKKIIEVALDFGYETASGFAKAFRREFGYSPTTYTARMRGMTSDQWLTRIGGFMKDPVIVEKELFKVAGYGIKTNLTSGYRKEIAAYWDTYKGENLERKMYAQLAPPKHGEVGICVPAAADEPVTYLLGVIVEDFSKVTPDMMTLEVPAAQYAVFTTAPIDLTDAEGYQNNGLSDLVRATWQFIFEEWFPGSGYVYDDSKIDFEFYDERCHFRPDATMDIFIPIARA